MASYTTYPRQDAFETQLSAEITASDLICNLVTPPSFSLSGGNKVYIGIDYDNNLYELAEITGISGNTVTLGTRGIALYEGGAGTARGHSSGAKVIISHTWKAFADVATAIGTKMDIAGGIFTGEVGFSGSTIAGIRLNNITTAQRDALASPQLGQKIYNTTTGTEQTYTGSGWSDNAAGATPDGSETVSGKYELSTLAEQGSSTSIGATGSRLIPANSNLVKTSSGAGDENKIAVLNSSGKYADGFQNISLTNAATLTGGGNADLLHTHNIVVSLPAGEAVNGTTTPQAVYVSDGTGGRTSGRFYRSDADDTSNAAHHFIGFVKVNASSVGTSYAVQTDGVVSGFTALTIGATYYIADTTGAISTSPSSTCVMPIGIAVSATDLKIEKDIAIQYATASQTAIAAGTNNYDTTIRIPRKAKEIEIHFRVSTRDTVNGPAAGGPAVPGQIYSMGTFIFNSVGSLVIAKRDFDGLQGADFDHTAGNLREAADFGATFNRLNQTASGLSNNVIGLAGGGNTSICTVTITATTENLVTVRFGFTTQSGTGSNGNDFYYAGIIVRS